MQRLGSRKLALAQTNPLMLQQIVLVSTDMQHYSAKTVSKGTACTPGRDGRGQRWDITYRSGVGLEVEGKTEEKNPDLTSYGDK